MTPSENEFDTPGIEEITYEHIESVLIETPINVVNGFYPPQTVREYNFFTDYGLGDKNKKRYVLEKIPPVWNFKILDRCQKSP